MKPKPKIIQISAVSAPTLGLYLFGLDSEGRIWRIKYAFDPKGLSVMKWKILLGKELPLLEDSK
jgi:hypothetical protein